MKRGGRLSMRIVYFGSSPFGLPSLDALQGSTHELVGLFTQPARPAGRHQTPRPTAVAQWACEHCLPCTEAPDINCIHMVQAVAACRADLLVVIAFGQKIGRDLIDMLPKGAINVHASLLPKYRGAAPVNWAIINGERETGISIITLADRMDAGLVLGQTSTEIGDEETADLLHDRLAQLAPPLLVRVIDEIAAGTAVYRTQDESAVTLARKLNKSHGLIDWARPAGHIANLVRGLWPWPGAQADYVSAKTSKCDRVTIAQAQPVPYRSPEIDAIGRLNENLHVICGDDALEIIRIKPAGGHLMDFRDFVNGRATGPRDLFLSPQEAPGDE